MRRRWARSALTAAGLFIVVHVIGPQLAGLRATAEQLAHATWWLPPVVIALEAASLAAYAQLVLVALRVAGESPSRTLILRTTVVGTSLGKTLPGGNTTALAAVVAALRREGVDPAKATAALAASGVTSSAVLALLLPLAAAFAIATGHRGAVVLGAAVSAVVLLAAALVVPLLLRDPERAASLARRVARAIAKGPLRSRMDPDGIAGTISRGVAGARAFATDRRALVRAVGWAGANWLFDIAVLWTLAMTIGRGTPLGVVLLAYAIGQLAQAVPLTPGAVGVVEPVMIGVFVGAGASGAAATATVLGWRLVSHWLPIVVGLALLPSLGHRIRPSQGTDPAAP